MIRTRWKIAITAVTGYALAEAYWKWRTSQLIEERKLAHQTHTIASSSPISTDKILAEPELQARFSSASVSGMFVNPFEEYRPQTAFEFLSVRVLEFAESLYGNLIEKHLKEETTDGTFEDVEKSLRVFRPDLEKMRLVSLQSQSSASSSQASQPDNKIRFTWLGQSCALIQICGINILTDPIFSDHLFSPHVGPKRLVKLPMSLSDVEYATGGKIDYILVSHNHPDHLDLDAARRIGNSATWVVPLGLRHELARLGISRVYEMDWWDKVRLPTQATGTYDVVCVPAMHWLGRKVIDLNVSLWGSFLIQRNGKSVLFHAGDTGYVEELFRGLGRMFGPVTLSMLPIGQYCPQWHQKPRHILPEEAVCVASHMKSKHMMGVHFGTFKLSLEPILEPKTKLLRAARAMKNENYRAPEFGKTYEFDIDQ